MMARIRAFHQPIAKSKAEDRLYGGRTYHSKTEMRRAKELDLLLTNGNIAYWTPQVRFQLGPDHHTVVDFLVYAADGISWVEEVKGYETPEFRRTRRLWKKYAPIPMRILVPRRQSGWKVEILAHNIGTVSGARLGSC